MYINLNNYISGDMEFYDQLWNSTNFSLAFDQSCAFFTDVKKFIISTESLHFPTFSAKC